MSNETTHPDLAEIDAARTGEASPEVCAHIDSCESCQQRLRDLRSLAEAAVGPEVDVSAIPGKIDDAVLTLIERRSKEIHWRRPSRITFASKPIWAAAAAILIVFLSLFMFSERTVQQPVTRFVELQGDIDGSGIVDVVDAYLLALRVDTGEGEIGVVDQNGDGTLDRSDVDAVMRRIVAVVEEA